MTTTNGIHHITAIASDSVYTLNFYTKILGLRLVKKTVNQDDVSTYHLFFGDKLGHPGMDLTFFIFLPSMQGKRGNGLVTSIALAVPEMSLDFWLQRLKENKVRNNGISERFDRKRITFFDKDNQQLELVGVPASEIEDSADIWTTKDISKDYAIRSFYAATLRVQDIRLVEPVLTSVFGYEKIAQYAISTLYKVPNSKRAAFLEVQEDRASAFGFNAAGTVHHIAFRAKDEAHQMELKNKLDEMGIQHTTVIDRFYFKSVYFRVPAGILFEIATDGPGFTADEKESELGKHLALPPFLESERKMIESQLIPLTTD